MTKKTVLLTGGSSGIGLATATLLSNEGFTVYATSRSGSIPVEHPSIHFIKADVNNTDQMRKLVQYIIQVHGTLDTVICNAGNGIAGSIEDCSMEEIRFQLETNFFGVVNTVQACLPSLRKNSRGQILIISSLAAVVPIPYQAFYAASKSASNILAQALAIEVKPFNIQVCSVLPGDTKTNFTQARNYATLSKSEDSAYLKKMLTSVKKMEDDEQNGMTSDSVARIIVAEVKAKKMRNVVVPGFSNKIFYTLARILPSKLIIAILNKLYN